MVITKKIVADKIRDYINKKISLSQLVDWSENILIDEKFEEDEFETLNEIISKLALADVKAFELSHEDFKNYLRVLDSKDNLNSIKNTLENPYTKSYKK